jgi:protease II
MPTLFFLFLLSTVQTSPRMPIPPGEFGRPWHAGGRLLTKANSTGDTIACLEHLIAKGYTSPGRIALRGHSAAGIVLGNTLIRRSELLLTLIAHRPFFDVLSCMTDPTLELTVQDYEEFGDPGVAEELSASANGMRGGWTAALAGPSGCA